MKIKIAPSILAGNFGYLAEEAKRAEDGGADLLHVDVMDGHFVPNITIGPDIVKGIRQATKLPIDAHLMIDHPDKYAEAFAKAGADMISVHVEAPHPLVETLKKIRSLGVKAGIVFNPNTHFTLTKEIASLIDYILIMSVNPGFGGQKFIADVLSKVTQARQFVTEDGRELDIEIDGGINAENAVQAAKAGANVLIAGSSVYGKPDVKEAISVLRKAGEEGIAQAS